MELLIGLMSTGLIVVLVKVALSDWFFGLAKAKKKPLKPAQKPNENWLAERLQKDLDAKRKTYWELRREWEKDFRELVQRACEHKYDMHSHRWWVCTECKYEKPWHYEEGCSCTFHSWQSYVNAHEQHVLHHRSGVCNIHGRDFEQYKKEAAASFNKELESKIKMTKAMMDLQKYSKGGFTN